jgi:hypothetical protein
MESLLNSTVLIRIVIPVVVNCGTFGANDGDIISIVFSRCKLNINITVFKVLMKETAITSRVVSVRQASAALMSHDEKRSQQ